MNPEPGQFIQVRFNNGVFFDAVVEQWSDEKSVVVLADSNDKVIIQKTLQDVLLVKIFGPKNIPEIKQQYKTEVGEEFETLKEQPKNDEKLARMSELKDELNKMDREEIFNKMASHKANGLRQVTYGIPSNIKISSAAQHTEQEITSTNSELNSELQKLFSKKH